MLYKKVLLDMENVDELRRTFHQYVVRQLVKDITYGIFEESPEELVAKQALEEFGLVLAPLEEHLQTKKDTSFAYARALLPFASSGDGISLGLAPFEYLEEYFDCLMVGALTRDSSYQACLAQEEEKIYAIVLETRGQIPSTESQSLIRKSFQASALTFYDCVIDKARGEELAKIQTQIENLRASYEREKDKLKSMLETLGRQQQDSGIRDIVSLFRTADGATGMEIAKLIGEKTPDFNGSEMRYTEDPNSAYLKGLSIIQGYETLPCRISELHEAIEKSDEDFFQKIEQLMKDEQEACKKTVPLIEYVEGQLKKHDASNYSIELEEIFYSYLLEAGKLQQGLNDHRKHYASDMEPFGQTEVAHAHLYGSLYKAVKDGILPEITADQIFPILSLYFGDPEQQVQENSDNYTRKFCELHAQKIQNPRYCAAQVRKEMEALSFEGILSEISMAARTKHIRFQEQATALSTDIKDKNGAYRDFAALFEEIELCKPQAGQAEVTEGQCFLPEKERETLNGAFASWERTIRDRETLSDETINQTLTAAAKVLGDFTDRKKMDYITADTESMVAFYTEQETLESPEVQGIMRERKQELEAVDFREQIIKGLVNILCKSSDLDNDDMNPHMQLRVFLYQQQQQPLMEKLQLVSGR